MIGNKTMYQVWLCIRNLVTHNPSQSMLGTQSKMKYSLVSLMTIMIVQSLTTLAYSQSKAPYLNTNPGGLPPFFASMQKHEVMVTVWIQDENGKKMLAPQDLSVGLRILAQGQKVRDYHEQTDPQGRAFFLGVPSNPKVQMAISYEVWVDYKGVRFPFELKGVPNTIDRNVLYDDFDPTKRLPENQVELTVLTPSQGLEGLSLHHNVIEFRPDEKSLIVTHEMTLKNQSTRVLDLSHQPQGGLRLEAPKGSKGLELHQKNTEDLEVRGSSLYYIGALLPMSEKKIRWYYTLPYRSDTYEWRQSMPIPSTVGIVVAPRDKQPQHQKTFPLGLIAGADSEVQALKNKFGFSFHTLKVKKELAANTALAFTITGLPIAPRWKRYALWASIAFVMIWVLFIGLRDPKKQSQFSRTHLMVERDRLLKTLARMELALAKKKMSQQRYQREKEIITARLVTLYRILDQVDQTS